MACSIDVLLINVLCFIYEHVTFMTESFLLFLNSTILLVFLKLSFKMFEPNSLYYKNKPCMKISFDLFFYNFIIDFFCLESAVRKELPYERSRTRARNHCKSNARLFRECFLMHCLSIEK